MRKFFLRTVNIIAMIACVSCAATTNKPSKKVSVDQEEMLGEKRPILGQWVGVLDVGAFKLTLAFDVSQDSKNLS